MKKLLLTTALAIAFASPLQADQDQNENQPDYADFNKALLQIGVTPEIAAVVAQVALTKTQEMALAQRQHSDDE